MSAPVVMDQFPAPAHLPKGFADPVTPDDAEDWRAQARCAQTDPEAFFPPKGGSNLDAKKVCADCPVRAQCLEYALATHQADGIWGGLSTKQRNSLRRTGKAA